MNIFFKSSITAAALTLLLSGWGTTVSAQEALVSLVTGDGPFDRSNTACEEAQAQSKRVSCTRIRMNILNGEEVTIEVYAKLKNDSAQNLIEYNAKFWGDDVTPKTVIPVNKRFFFAEDKYAL